MCIPRVSCSESVGFARQMQGQGLARTLKQAMLMLAEFWPAGAVLVRTMIAPRQKGAGGVQIPGARNHDQKHQNKKK